jgi:hypothetical protein
MLHKKAKSRCVTAGVAVGRVAVSSLEESTGIYAEVLSGCRRNVESLQSGRLLSVWKRCIRQISFREKP